MSQVQIPPIRLYVFWQKVQFVKASQEEHVEGHWEHIKLSVKYPAAHVEHFTPCVARAKGSASQKRQVLTVIKLHVTHVRPESS